MTTDRTTLKVLFSGLLHYDQSVFTFDRGCGVGVEVPTLAFLVEHLRGRVLFDTGLDPALVSRAADYWGEEMASMVRPEMSEGQDVVSQLSRMGLQPSDIDYVVMSCLFRDHAGSLKYFPDSTLIVAGVEIQNAHWPPAWLDATYNKPYEPNDLVGLRERKRIELFDEDWDIFGDGSVVVMSVPCHTQGEQAMVIRLPETGTVVLPAGVVPTKVNLDEEIMTGRLLVHPKDAYRSARRLKKLISDEDALVLFHHDPTDWKTYRSHPEMYA